ncbi:MAG: hypothetical protein AAFY57_05880 [Cyanobacteria bacterium J06642_2]
MSDPVFWLGLSVGLVGAGMFALLVTLLPAVRQLAEAGKSVKLFFDTLQRDLPPTLEALRLTGLEVSEIANSVDDGVKGASNIVKKVDNSLEGARTQTQNIGITTRSVAAGLRAGWQAFVAERETTAPPPALPKRRSRPPLPEPSVTPIKSRGRS